MVTTMDMILLMMKNDQIKKNNCLLLQKVKKANRRVNLHVLLQKIHQNMFLRNLIVSKIFKS